MLKGFKEFLARGNIVDLAVAVVIGTAFTALVTKFTASIIQPLIDRIGAGGGSEYGVLKINIGGGQTIDLNVLLSATINFVLVASVVYFLVVVPYNRLRKKGEIEQAQDTELSPAHRDPQSAQGRHQHRNRHGTRHWPQPRYPPRSPALTPSRQSSDPRKAAPGFGQGLLTLNRGASVASPETDPRPTRTAPGPGRGLLSLNLGS